MDNQLAQQIQAATDRFNRGHAGQFLVAFTGEVCGLEVWKTFTTPSPSVQSGPETLVINLATGEEVR